MPTVWPYSRAVMKTSSPRASRRSMIGRSTRGCAAAVQSTQIFIAGDPSEAARSEDPVLAHERRDPRLEEEELEPEFDLAAEPPAFLEDFGARCRGAGD